ncbi:MAG: glycosyltransferase [Rhodospirillales bacterium]|nr:glycosyltransferase [Rhodospirillales bacterium]
MSRPRLLFVSPRFLFPLDQGGKIRTTGILRAMHGGAFEIVLAAPAPADWQDHATEIGTICDRFVHWPEPRVGRIGRALAVVGPSPVAVATDRSAPGSAAIARELAPRPDLVVVDFPHAAVLMPARLAVPSILFTHNVETEIYERHAEVARGPWRHVWRREAAKMRRFEGAALRRFDRVIAVSARDGSALARRFGIADPALIDTGVDLDFYRFHPPGAQAATVVFSGAMDSRSNIDGIGFLMDEVWPLVIARRPDARTRVVGRNPPAALVARAKRLGLAWEFTGFVEDIRPHVLAGDVAVIPLRVGSGTRLKAFEAMALGRPVVSTALGMEGLDVVAGTHFLPAETAPDFAAAILRLLNQPDLRRDLTAAARALLEERFSWSRIGRDFEQICRATMERYRN